MEEIEPSSITGLRMGVTSGPTRAWIDPVRYIANASTGELGALIADRLAERGASVELIAGQGAVLPQHPSVRIHSIETIQDLENGLQSLAADAGSPFTAWIHAMAVLDYVPGNTSPTKIASGEPVLKMTL